MEEKQERIQVWDLVRFHFFPAFLRNRLVDFTSSSIQVRYLVIEKLEKIIEDRDAFCYISNFCLDNDSAAAHKALHNIFFVS